MKTKYLLTLLIFTMVSIFAQPVFAQDLDKKQFQIEKIFPNPVDDYVFVEFDSVEYGKVIFELIDILGNTVQKWKPANALPGTQKIRLDLNSLQSGVYLLRARINSESVVVRLRKV